MGVRLVLRIMQPPPISPPNTWAARTATMLHHAFYAAIIGQACMGFLASYVWFGIAPYHVIGSRIILAMVALHFAAAAWHALVARDDPLDRMLLPRRKSAGNL